MKKKLGVAKNKKSSIANLNEMSNKCPVPINVGAIVNKTKIGN